LYARRWFWEVVEDTQTISEIKKGGLKWELVEVCLNYV